MRGVPAARAAALVLATLVLATLVGPAGASSAEEGRTRDAENPRNATFSGDVVEWVSAAPRRPVRETGDLSAWREGEDVRFSARLRRLGDDAGPLEDALWTIDGRPRAALALAGVEGGPPGSHVQGGVRWTADGARRVVEVRWGEDRLTTVTDALRVLLLVERRTFAEGERRFGSFVRRFRKSLDDLHALFEASVWPLAPRGILDRFRIDDVRLYDREEGVPKEFGEHPEFDVAIACDEGGPHAGFSLPAHSIGHNFRGPPAHRGLWSSWGEQALWHELMHFRGVQDFYLSEVADGALPGRVRGVLRLPKRHARDLMASPYQPPVLGEYAAVTANFRRGVARVGACEDPENRYGHVWNWLPGRVDLVVTREGKPASGARVRWWRGRAAPGLADGKAQGVAADRVPDGEAVADAAGKASIGGDYLGRARPREDRSLWLLVEVEDGTERRFDLLYGLDMNLAYARGHKYVWTVPWRVEDLLRPGAPPPPGR